MQMVQISKIILIIHSLTFSNAVIPPKVQDVLNDITVEAYTNQDEHQALEKIRKLIIKLAHEIQVEKDEHGTD